MAYGRGKPDTMQAPILMALDHYDLPVQVISQFPGVLDLIVGTRSDTLLWVEVKTPGESKGLSPKEKAIMKKWEKFPVMIVYSPMDMLLLCGVTEISANLDLKLITKFGINLEGDNV